MDIPPFAPAPAPPPPQSASLGSFDDMFKDIIKEAKVTEKNMHDVQMECK